MNNLESIELILLEFTPGEDGPKNKRLINQLENLERLSKNHKVAIVENERNTHPRLTINQNKKTHPFLEGSTLIELYCAIEKTKTKPGGRASVEKIAKITKIDLYFNS